MKYFTAILCRLIYMEHLFNVILFLVGEMPTALPTIYEYFFDSEQGKWVPWAQLIPKYIHEPDKKFNEILVPTIDTVRTTWLLGLQCKVRRPVLLVGETGTSKTATTSNFLREMDKETNVCVIYYSTIDKINCE